MKTGEAKVEKELASSQKNLKKAKNDLKRLTGTETGLMRRQKVPKNMPMDKQSRVAMLKAQAAILEFPELAPLLRAGCTLDGARWVLQMLNPFPDKSEQNVGYPGGTSDRTTLQKIPLTMQFAAPDGLGADQSWDLHLFTLPDINPQGNFLIWDTVGPYGFASQAVAQGIAIQPGILNAIRVLSGQPTLPNTVGAVFNPTLFTADRFDVGEYLTGNTRIVGLGFEVYNTTMELNKNGQVIYYRQPNVVRSCNYNYNSFGNPGTGPYLTFVSNSPPATFTEAQKLGGSIQRQATDGAYIVCTQSEKENPLTPFQTGKDLYVRTQRDGDAGLNIAGWGGTNTTQNINGSVLPSSDQLKIVPYDVSGAYFSGLSATSTFTVVLNVFVESAPASDDPNLFFAQPPSAFDARAIEIYSQIARTIAPGAPVSENGFGDWLAKIMGTISKIAEPVGNALGVVFPPAAMVGRAVGTITRQLESTLINN